VDCQACGRPLDDDATERTCSPECATILAAAALLAEHRIGREDSRIIRERWWSIRNPRPPKGPIRRAQRPTA
jgi:hypothetical protein